jgi:predicted nucleic acid-binding Zn ribbon protein
LRNRAGRTVGVGESLVELSERLKTAPPRTLSQVFDHWPETAGHEISRHSRPERIEDGTLHVVADSPAWASRLKTVAPSLLERIGALTGGDSPSRLAVRVRPSR